MLFPSWLLLLPFLVEASTHPKHSKYSHTHSERSPSKRANSYAANAGAAFDALQAWYANGWWKSAGWWQWANCLTVVADLQAVDGARKDAIGKVFDEVYSQNNQTKFLNDFYDDEGWWALAWIAVYDITKDNKYLDTAKALFDDMDKGWNGTCKGGDITGGMLWNKKPDKKGKHYLAAISNELYISVAAHLANRAQGPYKDKATRGWTWLHGSGMINSTGLFNDGLRQKDCTNNGANGWTYNQGVILGGLVELSNATNDTAFLDSATSIANAALKQNPGPILRDNCEPVCKGGNAQQFKGPFMRNLAKLYVVTKNKQYQDFITANADSIWATGRDKTAKGPAANQIGLSWSTYVAKPNAVTHNSAMAGLVAAIAVTK